METLFSSVGDDLRHVVGTVGRVESSSTFPTITTVPTKTIQGARKDGRGNEPVGSCAMCDARSTGPRALEGKNC